MLFNRLWKKIMAALLIVAFAPIAYFGLQDFKTSKNALADEAVRRIFLNCQIRSKDLERAFSNAHSDIRNLRFGFAVTSLLEVVRDRPEDYVFWTRLVEKEFVNFLTHKPGYSAVGLLDEYGEEVAVVRRSGALVRAEEDIRKRNHATSAHFLEAARQEGLKVAAITMQTMVPSDVDLRSVTLTRYATKVFDSRGVATGIIYLDLNGSQVMEGLSKASLENKRVAAMVTNAGNYIYNPFSAKSEAVSTTSALREENIRHQYSKNVARQILSGGAGIITDDPSYMFAYNAVYPEKDTPEKFFVVYDRQPWKLLEPAIGMIYQKYALGAAGALLLSVLVSMALSRALTSHINTLREGVERFALRKEGNARINVRSGDEIESLAKAFNQMADSLMEYSHSLEKKVEERSAKIKEVERKLMQAEKLAAIGFLSAGVAHEINNPISVVVTRLELIRRAVEKGETEKVKKDLEVVHHHAVRIGKIAGNLLTFSRSKPGELAPVDLNEMVMRVVELIEHPIRKKGIRLDLALDSSLPFVQASGSGMEQVIYNILYNAYQASGKDSVIDIKSAPGGEGKVKLSISDTGPGIPQEALSHIFEPFFTTKSVGQGAGLGLSISYGLVKEFGGGIEVKSRPGKTVFTITLGAAFKGMGGGKTSGAGGGLAERRS